MKEPLSKKAVTYMLVFLAFLIAGWKVFNVVALIILIIAALWLLVQLLMGNCK